MICRLCLTDLNEFVSIFEDPGFHTEFSISKMISKYFHIEVDKEDAVSNKICNTCYNHLNEFHRFWLLVEEKQQILQAEFLNDDIIQNDLETKEQTLVQCEDFKDVPLYEQPIDDVLPLQSELKVEDFFSANNDVEDDYKDEDNLSSIEEKSTSIKSDTEPNTVPKQRHVTLKRSRRLLTRKCRTSHKNKSKISKKNSEKPTNKIKTDCSTNVTCHVCKKVSANKYALKKHMYRSHPSDEELKYPCNLCVKKFAKKFLLDDHINWHQEAEKKNMCELCKKGFYSRRELKAHRKSLHANELKIICDSCGRSFKCKPGYDNHYATVHLGITKPEVQCQICKVWLKNDKVLYKHMYNHRDENSVEEFTCNICGVVKSSRAKLSRHKSYHHPDKMHKCTLCNKEFKILIGLEEHMAVHNGQPLYSCCFCPHTFKSIANMYTHKRRIHPHEWESKKAQAKRVAPSNVNNALEA